MALNIRDALDESLNNVIYIRTRNKTLIDYYIDRNTVPSVIAAYDPRLARLENRIRAIKKLNFNHLQQIIDDPDCLAASHLISIITELTNSVWGFKDLFERYYDPDLRQRAPYAQTYEELMFLQSRLEGLIQTRQSDPTRRLAEHIVAQPVGSERHFCRGAVQVINRNDMGTVTSVRDKDLLLQNRQTLAARGGAYLWWTCPNNSCSFRLRFHVLSSYESSIHTNSEIRTHPSIPIEYRSIFLIKSHLHSTSTKSGSTKYGCLFCFSEGRPLVKGSTAFTNGKELAAHICASHGFDDYPSALMLEKVRVAIGGENPIGVTRWDAHLLRS